MNRKNQTIALVEHGFSVPELAELWCVKENTMYHYLKRNAISLATYGIEAFGYDNLKAKIDEGLTTEELGQLCGVTASAVSAFARRRGWRVRKRDMTGANNPSWRGGVKINSYGYRLLLVPKSGPYGYLVQKSKARDTSPNGYAFEHRIVMHDEVGRQLRPEEEVHHRDQDPLNNAPSNLQLCADHAAHIAVHLAEKGAMRNWRKS